MLQSKLFTKASKHDPKDETALNAKLLERGGFIYKNSAGIYSFLPLGWRVIQKIAGIIREEMNKIGGQEIFMPALVEKKYLDASGRWDVEVGYKIATSDPEPLRYGASMRQATSKSDASFALGWTHEEVITAIASRYVSSYKDLPFSAYQVQTKFRNEPRAKSGLLRGKEFIMKDLYSFHADEEDLRRYYEKVKDAYFKIFERYGLKAIYTLAAGGTFTAENTHEFQVVADVGVGEDTIFICSGCRYAENKEVSKLKDGDGCSKCNPSTTSSRAEFATGQAGSGDNGSAEDPPQVLSPERAKRVEGRSSEMNQGRSGKIEEKKSIEVGNIFPLGTKYSEAFNLKFRDEKGEEHFVVMGSYGIGLGRVMGTVVEIHNDKNGIIWPESIAPYKTHLLDLGGGGARDVYEKLQKAGIEVLYDDREMSAGEKFAEADLLGIPWRFVVSAKTGDRVEIKKREEESVKIVSFSEATKLLGE